MTNQQQEEDRSTHGTYPLQIHSTLPGSGNAFAVSRIDIKAPQRGDKWLHFSKVIYMQRLILFTDDVTCQGKPATYRYV
jgi:hypothetical protein